MQTTASVSWSLRTVSRVLLAIMLLLMPAATLLPGTGPPSSEAASYMHLASMAVAGFLACACFATLQARAGAVVFVFAYSALMELFQHWLPFRNGTWDDVQVNALGCLVGVVVFIIVQRLTGRLTGRA